MAGELQTEMAQRTAPPRAADPFAVRRPKRPLAAAVRGPDVLVVVLRAGWCSVSLGAAVVIWELTLGAFSGFFALAAATSLAVMVLRGDLRPRMIPDLTSSVSRTALSVTIGMGLTLIANTAFSLRPLSGEWLLGQLAALLGAALLGVWLGIQALRREWRRGGLRSKAIIVGTSELAVEFAVEIGERQAYGVDVIGMVGEPGGPSSVASFLGDITDLPELVRLFDVDRLIVMPGITGGETVVRAIRWANTAPGVSVFVVPRFYDLGLGMDSVSPDRVRGYPLTQLDRVTHREFGMLGKRLFDIAAAGTALLLAAPLLVVIAALVKLSDPRGPVFFRQERVGRYGEVFSLFKFRSMRESKASDSEWMGEAEARVTRIGSILRRTSLDEIPQLFNVARGDMSLVGPRPERPHFAEQFSATVPGYADRLRMPVGLTGLAQIVGLRGDTSIEQRVKYDNIYIDQWRFMWDLEILVKTVAAVLKADKYAAAEQQVEQQLASATGRRRGR